MRANPQRGIYPPESFARVSKYGLQMLVTSDAGLQKYLQQVLTQLSEWLYAGSVQKLVLVITSLETQTVRWARSGRATRASRAHHMRVQCTRGTRTHYTPQTLQVLERWNFDIETDSSSVQKPDQEHEKSEKVCMPLPASPSLFCLCTKVHAYTHMHPIMHACIHTYIHINTHTHTQTHVHMRVYVCVVLPHLAFPSLLCVR